MNSVKNQNRESYLDDESQNQALLKKFEDLRQKLKAQTKENNALKQELEVWTVKFRHNEEALNYTLTNNIELKDKCTSLNTQNQQLKKKVVLMKETVQGQANYYQEIQFTKHALIQMKTHSDMLAQERQKLLEISLSQKMHFEEEMTKMKSKIASDQQFIQQIEGNYNKSKQTILRLENQIKKISITYEQEVFNKNWTESNFQTQILLNTIKDLQKDVVHLKAKNKKQKQKRVIFEDRIIQLQEIAGFHSVKAETFEGEIQMVTQKYEKMEKKYKDANKKADKVSAEKLEAEQNLAKTLVVYEELSKKLKELNIQQVNFLLQESQNKLAFVSKLKKQIDQLFLTIHQSTSKLIDRTATSNSTKSNHSSAIQSNHSRILQQKNNNIESKSVSKSKPQLYGSNMTFGDQQEQSQNTIIQNKIRKERQEMERRIKEKILSRKLQTSAPSQQFRVRGDYIKTFIERRY